VKRAQLGRTMLPLFEASAARVPGRRKAGARAEMNTQAVHRTPNRWNSFIRSTREKCKPHQFKDEGKEKKVKGKRKTEESRVHPIVLPIAFYLLPFFLDDHRSDLSG
jgi:hypothetical protein